MSSQQREILQDPCKFHLWAQVNDAIGYLARDWLQQPFATAIFLAVVGVMDDTRDMHDMVTVSMEIIGNAFQFFLPLPKYECARDWADLSEQRWFRVYISEFAQAFTTKISIFEFPLQNSSKSSDLLS